MTLKFPTRTLWCKVECPICGARWYVYRDESVLVYLRPGDLIFSKSYYSSRKEGYVCPYSGKRLMYVRVIERADTVWDAPGGDGGEEEGG